MDRLWVIRPNPPNLAGEPLFSSDICHIRWPHAGGWECGSARSRRARSLAASFCFGTVGRMDAAGLTPLGSEPSVWGAAVPPCVATVGRGGDDRELPSEALFVVGDCEARGLPRVIRSQP